MLCTRPWQWLIGGGGDGAGADGTRGLFNLRWGSFRKREVV